MKSTRQTRAIGRSPYGARRGTVLMLVMVASLIIGMLLMAALRTAIRRHQQIKLRAWQTQADWLVEAGLERAAARLRQSRDYTGETWAIPAAELDSTHAATVEIRVAAVTDAAGRNQVSVSAIYPNSEHHRVQRSKDVFVDLPKP